MWTGCGVLQTPPSGITFDYPGLPNHYHQTPNLSSRPYKNPPAHAQHITIKKHSHFDPFAAQTHHTVTEGHPAMPAGASAKGVAGLLSANRATAAQGATNGTAGRTPLCSPKQGLHTRTICAAAGTSQRNAGCVTTQPPGNRGILLAKLHKLLAACRQARSGMPNVGTSTSCLPRLMAGMDSVVDGLATALPAAPITPTTTPAEICEAVKHLPAVPAVGPPGAGKTKVINTAIMAAQQGLRIEGDPICTYQVEYTPANWRWANEDMRNFCASLYKGPLKLPQCKVQPKACSKVPTPLLPSYNGPSQTGCPVACVGVPGACSYRIILKMRDPQKLVEILQAALDKLQHAEKQPNAASSCAASTSSAPPAEDDGTEDVSGYRAVDLACNLFTIPTENLTAEAFEEYLHHPPAHLPRKYFDNEMITITIPNSPAACKVVFELLYYLTCNQYDGAQRLPMHWYLLEQVVVAFPMASTARPVPVLIDCPGFQPTTYPIQFQLVKSVFATYNVASTLILIRPEGGRELQGDAVGNQGMHRSEVLESLRQLNIPHRLEPCKKDGKPPLRARVIYNQRGASMSRSMEEALNDGDADVEVPLCYHSSLKDCGIANVIADAIKYTELHSRQALLAQYAPDKYMYLTVYPNTIDWQQQFPNNRLRALLEERGLDGALKVVQQGAAGPAQLERQKKALQIMHDCTPAGMLAILCTDAEDYAHEQLRMKVSDVWRPCVDVFVHSSVAGNATVNQTDAYRLHQAVNQQLGAQSALELQHLQNVVDVISGTSIFDNAAAASLPAPLNAAAAAYVDAFVAAAAQTAAHHSPLMTELARTDEDAVMERVNEARSDPKHALHGLFKKGSHKTRPALKDGPLARPEFTRTFIQGCRGAAAVMTAQHMGPPLAQALLDSSSAILQALDTAMSATSVGTALKASLRRYVEQRLPGQCKTLADALQNELNARNAPEYDIEAYTDILKPAFDAAHPQGAHKDNAARVLSLATDSRSLAEAIVNHEVQQPYRIQVATRKRLNELVMTIVHEWLEHHLLEGVQRHEPSAAQHVISANKLAAEVLLALRDAGLQPQGEDLPAGCAAMSGLLQSPGEPSDIDTCGTVASQCTVGEPVEPAPSSPSSNSAVTAMGPGCNFCCRPASEIHVYNFMSSERAPKKRKRDNGEYPKWTEEEKQGIIQALSPTEDASTVKGCARCFDRLLTALHNKRRKVARQTLSQEQAHVAVLPVVQQLLPAAQQSDAHT